MSDPTMALHEGAEFYASVRHQGLGVNGQKHLAVMTKYDHPNQGTGPILQQCSGVQKPHAHVYTLAHT